MIVMESRSGGEGVGDGRKLKGLSERKTKNKLLEFPPPSPHFPPVSASLVSPHARPPPPPPSVSPGPTPPPPLTLSSSSSLASDLMNPLLLVTREQED